MELKRTQQNSWLRIATEKIRDHRVWRFLIILLTILLYTSLVFGYGYYVHWSGFSLGQTVRSLKDTPRRLQAIVAPKPEIEHIAIDIKHENLMKLAYQREVALAGGILTSGNDDLVPATIRHNGELVKVKLRLKGDSTDHLEGDKWSFRIKVNGDQTLFGMKQFSIHHPKTRNYLYEWIFHQALNREGLLSLRYEFINVTLNGKDLGVYALEEHFEKHLIEHNRLREGPIVRFSEDMVWQELFQNPISRDYLIFDSFLPVEIDTYQTGEMLSDSSSYDQHTRAIFLLESFRRGDLKTSDVFDVQKLARFFAIVDLTGAQHGVNWSNMRFYYNPITSRLEPIGFDGDAGRRIGALSAGLSPLVDTIFLETIFHDLRFFEEYVTALERISEPAYLDALLADMNDDLKRNENLLYREFFYFDFTEEVLYQNQQYIRRVLNPTKGLHAYFHGVTDNYIELELGNIQSIPIEVLSVSYKDFPPFHPVKKIILSERPVNQFEPPFIDYRLTSRETVDYQIVRFKLPEGFVWSEVMAPDLKINYKLLGASRVREEIVYPWPYLDQNFAENDFFRQEPNAHTFEFLVIDEATQQIRVIPGTWNLDRSLIIPGGYRVIAGEDTEWNLSNSATILSYSPLEFIGSEDDPIIIQSTDSTGQGLVVMNAKQTSVLRHVAFHNLSNPAQSGWELTGAVTFYESPVAISQAQFIGNRSEDALNIVRSEFSIDKSRFSETSFDAFDADFTKGKITDSYFLQAGNDAIDASGSIIELENIFIDGASDKGLSIGERSQISAANVDIKNAQIAVASKDKSRITVRDIKISDSAIGLTAYQKKSEFGAASMAADGLEMKNVSIPYLVEKQSRLVVDNELIEAGQENVYQTLYGVE